MNQSPNESAAFPLLRADQPLVSAPWGLNQVESDAAMDATKSMWSFVAAWRFIHESSHQ